MYPDIACKHSSLPLPASLPAQHQKDSKFGSKPLQGPPFFFGKPADAIVDCSQPNAEIPYPTETQLLHFEIEQARAETRRNPSHRNRPEHLWRRPDCAGTFGVPAKRPPLALRRLPSSRLQVVALKAGGVNIPAREALKTVFGYGVGVDLTRRDLQRVALDSKRPWDMAKARGLRCGSFPFFLSPPSEMEETEGGPQPQRAPAGRRSTSPGLCPRSCGRKR